MQTDLSTAAERGRLERAPLTPPAPAGHRWARHGLLLLPLLLLFWTGWRGIDFGNHWDESIQAENLQQAIESQTLLPKWYRYPSVLFWMNLAALAPEVLEQPPRDGAEMQATQTRLAGVVRSKPFRLRVRTLFLAVTCLSLVWTYAIAFLWRGRVLEAFLAASLLGLSFEVAYHARWIAPDGVLMQFGALTLMLTVLAIVRSDPRWLAAAAVAAGLGCGTKYTGGILLLPLFIGAFQVGGPGRVRARLTRCAGLTLLFALAFLLSTPGAVLQPFVFFRHVGFEIEHYRTGHYGATVEAGLPHLAAMLRYLTAELFSQRPELALSTSILALLGLVSAMRDAPRRALLLACLPVAYLLYMSTQRVLFVRNLLLVAPVLALFCAHGATRGVEWLSSLRAAPRQRQRNSTVFAGVLLAALWTANGSFLVRSSQSIRQRDTDQDVRAALEWMRQQSEQRFFVSARLARRAQAQDVPLPANATRDRRAAVDAAAFFPSETPSNSRLFANRPGTALRVFGPSDVNFPYYPAWPNPKIVIYPREAARQAGLLAADGL